MAKTSKKKSNSRSARKEKTNKQPSNTSKETNKSKFVLSDSDISKIKDKTNELIFELEKRLKNPFLFREKNLIKSQIKDLKNFLETEQFYLLDSKLKSLEEIQDKERKEIQEEEKLSKQKVKKEKKIKSFSDFSKALKEFDYWPLFSRIKRINNNYDGSEKNKRIALVISVFVLLVIISLIGLLLILNVIPYLITADTQRFGPLLIFVIPIVVLFFV